MPQTIPANLWAVRSDGVLGIWNSLFERWSELHFSKGRVETLAKDLQGNYWSVGSDGKACRWNGSEWIDGGYSVGRALKMLAFNKADGSTWCVDRDGQLCWWNDGIWADRGGTIKAAAFDGVGGHYVVFSDGSLGTWATNAWISFSNTKDWHLATIAIDPGDASGIWFARADGTVGKCSINSFNVEDWGKIGGWDISWLHFD